MEDSSTNPYIPGGEQLQRKVTKPQTAFARLSKTILIGAGVLVLLIGIALIFILQRTSAVDDKARGDLAAALQPSEQLSKLVTIQSKLGFTLSYPDQLFSSHGELGASRIAARGAGDEQAVSQTFENNDLKIIRDYGYVRITPNESSERSRAAVTLPPELEINSYDKSLLLQTDEQKAAEAEAAKDKKTTVKGQLSVGTFVAIDNKKRLGERTSDDGTVVTIEATKPVRQEIAGIEYQKVRYTTRNENYQVHSEKYDDCYYTIQNDQPYSACVINVRPNKVAVASLLEDTIRYVSYQSPEQSAATDDKDKPTTADNETPGDSEDEEAIDTDKEAEQITVQPLYLKSPEILKALAKNQPSVMRLGTLYCANIDLKRVDGSTGTTLTNACASKMASGAFISKSGHIATAGHVARFDPKEAISGYINMAESQDEMLDRLQRVIDYLLDTRLLLETSAEYLKTGATTGNQDALAKIENLGSIIPTDYVQVQKEEYSYAVQLTDKPIVLNRATGNKPSFAYSDTVVKADFVKSDYDASKYHQEQFDAKHSTNDVAILKINGTFPVVPIGAGDGLGANQKLITIGFPAFSDGNLTADTILNVPIATQSSVNQTFDLEGKKVIDVNVPILPGNDGAPVFDEAAKLAGFAAYGPSYCPDGQCFGSGTIRSSNELSALIDKHNIELENKSPLSDTWSAGIDAYFAGNYQTAAGNFDEAGKLYGLNQWAPKLTEVAKSKFGSTSDTSLMNTLASFGIGAIIFLVVGAIILGVLLIIHLKRLDVLQVGHYGADGMSPAPIQSTVIPPAPTAPVQQQYYSSSQPVQQWPQQVPPPPQPLPPSPQPPQSYPNQPNVAQPQPPQEPTAPNQPDQFYKQ